jgi:hypothetical protein
MCLAVAACSSFLLMEGPFVGGRLLLVRVAVAGRGGFLLFFQRRPVALMRNAAWCSPGLPNLLPHLGLRPHVLLRWLILLLVVLFVSLCLFSNSLSRSVDSSNSLSRSVDSSNSLSRSVDSCVAKASSSLCFLSLSLSDLTSS